MRSPSDFTSLQPLQLNAAWVTIAATEFDVVVQFYQMLLGRSPEPFQENIYAEFQLPGLRLGIFRPETRQQAEFSHSQQSGYSLCLSVTDLAQSLQQLQSLPAITTGEIMKKSYGVEAYVYDPSGNRLILYQPLP